MKNKFDVIVVGTGAMGSAAAYHLSRQKQTVLAIDRYSPPHNMGSSHGETRIIREAYFEGPQYVPIVQRAYENWQQLEKEYGQQLYLPTGGLMIGYPDSEIVSGAKLSADLHRLPYKVLNAKDVMKQYPVYRLPHDMVAILEARAGIVFPEKCIDAHISIAGKQGVNFLFNETALSWQKTSEGFCVNTSSGNYYGDKLLLTAGAWINDFLKDHELPLTIERQVLYWFQPKKNADLFKPGNFPIFSWTPDETNDFYGFPDIGTGIKIAKHHNGEITDPDTINRNVKPVEIEEIRNLLSEILPDANGELMATSVCMYSNTPDFHFRISHHPLHKEVLVASICSGHGFKFSSAMGEVLTDILLHNRSSFDLSLFGYPK